MSTLRPAVAWLLTLGCLLGSTAPLGAGAAFAQSPPILSPSGASIPIRTLAPTMAATDKPVRSILGNVRETPKGELLVNDGSSRQLLRFDASLKQFTVLRDSVSGNENSYGPRSGVLYPFVADSMLFLDFESGTLIVVSPYGDFTHAMALPNARDFVGGGSTRSASDALGRLIYPGSRAIPAAGNAAKAPAEKKVLDSIPMLRGDFDKRQVDTIGRIKVSVPDERVSTGEGGSRRVETIINPLQTIDNWAVVTDGTVALVRGYDYHVDWISTDGTLTKSPRMPFAWRQLTDAEKMKLIDSVRVFRDKQDSVAAARARAEGRPVNEIIRIVDGRNVSVPDPTTYVRSFVPLGAMADYYPPMRDAATRADNDNNLWILPTTTVASINGELVYDVVNRKGELFERVRVPEGRSIAGFGKGGVVYLMYRTDKGWFIERTRVMR